MTLAERVGAVRGRIAESARRVGREPSEITLVAVSKGQPMERVLEAHHAGVRDFGENTAQGLEEKAVALAQAGCAARWHFIGRLQRNKVNLVLRHATLIHSIDRAELVSAIGKRSAAPVEVLVQVNLGDEPQKGGVARDAALALCREVAATPTLRLLGLMTVPPVDRDPRPYFSELARLREALRRVSGCEGATHLSMGMSDDYELAVEAGATLVRVGTALFGPRPQQEQVNP